MAVGVLEINWYRSATAAALHVWKPKDTLVLTFVFIHMLLCFSRVVFDRINYGHYRMYLNINGEPTQTSSTKVFPWDYLCYYLRLIRMFSPHTVATTRRLEEDFTRRVHGRPNRYEIIIIIIYFPSPFRWFHFSRRYF